MPLGVYVKSSISALFTLGLTIGILVLTESYRRGLHTETPEIRSFKGHAVLDSVSQYEVTWSLCTVTKIITFEVKVHTKGWVGFGISSEGGMEGADMIVGGISPTGEPYFEDRYAEGKQEPSVDQQQDWTLSHSSQINGVTELKFSRPLVTCDEHDVPITTNAQSFIWAIGETDDFGYHGVERRGAFPLNILDPPTQQVDLSQYETMDFITNVTIPAKETVYWCSLHRTPKLSGQSHVVAFGPKVRELLALRHTHHLTLNMCKPPPHVAAKDTEKFFDSFMTEEGQDCFNQDSGSGNERSNPLEISQYCTTGIYAWAMGVTPMLMPENVGFPIGEFGVESRQYFLLELHLDNPGAKKDIRFETGMQLYYTKNLRSLEAGLLYLGAASDWHLTIPPNSTSFRIAGHCASSCTNYIEPEGYNIFNVQLHAHNSAKIRLRHFRSGQELPWIANDQTYNNKFQTNRDVPRRKFLRQDQLTLECAYDTRWMNGSTAIGGYGTKDQMCATIIFYYPLGRVYACKTQPFTDRIMELTGIERFEDPWQVDPIITEPVTLKGLKYSTFVNSRLNWTQSLENEMKYEQRFAPQSTFCEIKGLSEAPPHPPAFYPRLDKLFSPDSDFTNCKKAVP